MLNDKIMVISMVLISIPSPSNHDYKSLNNHTSTSTMLFQCLLLLGFGTIIKTMSDFEDSFDEQNHIDVTCQEQSNIDDIEAELNRLSQGIITEEIMCFLKCRLLKKNYMSEDGTIYPELIKKRLYQFMEDWDKNLDCLEAIPPIVTCKDVEPLIKCIND